MTGFKNRIIPKKGYFLISTLEYKDAFNADIAYSGANYSITDDNAILLYDNAGNLVDKVGYGLASDYEKFPARSPSSEKSIERKNFQDTDNNHDDFNFSDVPTPQSSFADDNENEEEEESYSTEIVLNEIFPHPDEGGDEFIEIYNSADEKIDLNAWSLHDASKSGEYVFSSADSIDAKKYLVIYGNVYKFALNNGGDESITLYDPDKKEISKVSYSGSKKGAAYAFDEKDWRWTKFLTPGEKNIFEDVPKGELKMDDDVYVNVFANFEIDGLSKKAKVTWNFGDGHKSYLQKTRHKYKKTGEYEASVKYSEGSEDTIKNFTVEVGKIPHPKVKIVSVNTNPVGSDTENETITVQNKSKKKINLNGWSIATGWKELVNHPITEDFEIKAGKEKEITRQISKFTLNNMKNKIELRYPDGKVAYDVKYNKKEKSILEGELYVKGKSGWSWQNKNVESIKYNVSSIDAKNQKIDNQMPSENIRENVEEEKTESVEIQNADVEMYTDKKEIPALLALDNKYVVKIKLLNSQSQTLNTETVREFDDTYYFTPQYPSREHYAIAFLKIIILNINTKLNLLLNYFN